MTDDEIMKALECCAYWESDKSCEDCPENTYGFGCGNKLSKHSLDLINRQKSEIERLKQELEKELPKTVVKDEYHHNCCPNCGWIVSYDEGWGEKYVPHCENCGQAIDWSKEE